MKVIYIEYARNILHPEYISFHIKLHIRAATKFSLCLENNNLFNDLEYR